MKQNLTQIIKGILNEKQLRLEEARIQELAPDEELTTPERIEYIQELHAKKKVEKESLRRIQEIYGGFGDLCDINDSYPIWNNPMLPENQSLRFVNVKPTKGNKWESILMRDGIKYDTPNEVIEQGIDIMKGLYERKVEKLMPEINRINEKASVTGFDPITNIDELPFYHPDIIIAKPDRELPGQCGTVYKVFDRKTDNRKGMIRALKINKEDTVSGTKILADGDPGLHTPHIIRREEKTDIISREIGYSLDWFDDSLDDYLGKGDNKKYFKNGLNIVEIDQFSKQLTQIMWEYHNTREELCLDGKPENVMVNPNSADEYPDLVYSDTGISTPIDRSKSKASRNSVGTEYIRSPKLFRDSADSDVKDDIFSIASNIYNLFTGEFLFQEEIDEGRGLKNGSLDTFIDSLLDEREINRGVMDSVLTKKFKGKKIPKQYQDVIRAGALGDYENTDELKMALTDAKEKYNVRISKYGKWGMASGIGGLAMAGLLAINTLMSNYDVTGNLGRTLANFNNFSKVENINPRNLANDNIHLDKLVGNDKFLMIAESDYSNPSNEELDSLKQDIENARFGKSMQIIKPWSLALGNAGIYQTSGEKKTTTEFVVDHFKNTKEGNTVQNTIIYSVLNSLKNLDLSMEMDFFPNDTLVTTSWFKNSIDDCLNENYGLSTEDYPTAKAKNLDKIRDYFTLNLARNYDEEIGKIDMENFVVELLLGYKRLNEARDISGKTDFIGYTNSVKNNEILPEKSKEQIEFSKKYQDKMDANIKYFKQNSDSLKELSMRDRLFYALIMNQDEKREINNIFIKSIKSTTKINRYGAIPGKEMVAILAEKTILPGMKSNLAYLSEGIGRVDPNMKNVDIHSLGLSEENFKKSYGGMYVAGTTIPIFSTTDRIAMQYVLHNLQNDLGQEMIPYLPGQENSLEVLGNSINSILEGMENGGVPDAQSIPEGFIKMAESVKINMKTFGLLLNQDNFESTQYTVNPNYIKMFELYSQLIRDPEITKNDKFRKEYQKIQNNLNN